MKTRFALWGVEIEWALKGMSTAISRSAEIKTIIHVLWVVDFVFILNFYLIRMVFWSTYVMSMAQ